MNNIPKVLIVCDAPWQENNNIGNTFTNLFEGWPQDKIAMVYAKPMLPDTKVCSKFFQISEKRMIKRLFSSKIKVGQGVDSSTLKNIENNEEEISGKKMYGFFLKYRFSIFLFLRELLWKIVNWKTDELNKFVDEFKPDIVFSLASATIYMNKLQQYIINRTKAKSVLYFVDDVYSNKKFRISLIYWIKKNFIRKNIRNTVKISNIVYTIIDKQKQEYDNIFKINSKILNKGGNFSEPEVSINNINFPIKMIYTGNITLGRWKTLAEIGKSLDKINEKEEKISLEIYSNNPIYKKIKKTFDKIRSSELKGSVPANMVKSIQSNADILVHVESFELKERLETRLSFSTKLVDYFERGKCIVAVGWRKNASIDYLANNESAIIIASKREIFTVLRDLLDDLTVLNRYAKNAYELGRKNHNSNVMKKNILDDFKKNLNN